MALAAVRRLLLKRKARKIAVPVIVVGNITVGGTGKTPIIVALVKAFAAAGYRPGVVARGYGAKLAGSQILPANAQAADYGDEPVLISQATGCGVAVGPSRAESAALLHTQCGCDVIFSDDGLQHYHLHRDVEIAVIDGTRLLGNGWQLPVGPLREGRGRLQQVDFVLINGAQDFDQAPKYRSFNFILRPLAWLNLVTGERKELESLSLKNAVAVAGIGNPQRFFKTLESLGFSGQCHSFADHHAFVESDFHSLASSTVLMTEKDAVKCRQFASSQWWALSVEAQLPSEFVTRLLKSLNPD